MRSAIVTGGSAGIGQAVARRLADLGYGLTLAARGRDRLIAAAASLGEHAHVHEYDAADAVAARPLVDGHVARFGTLDLVVVNAGLGRPGKSAATETHALDAMYAVNVRAAYALVAAATAPMRASARDGSSPWFVFTSSIVGIHPAPGFSGYSAMKAAQVSLARSINSEAADDGIRACAICPGFVDTDMSAWVRDEIEPSEMIPPSDVARTVEYLIGLSPSAIVSEIVLGRRSARHPHAP